MAQGALWWEGAETMVGLADLWAWDKGPSGHLPIVGRLGHLEAADGEAAVEFLRQTCAVLSQRGCNHVLGPMDGSTWQSYRCATDWHQGQPFFGEPQTDPRWVEWLAQAGFTPVAWYESRLCRDLTDTHAPRRQRHRPGAFRISHAVGLDLESLLPQIHRVVMASFRRQPFFQPLPEEVFISLLRPMISQVDPTLVQLAWDQDRLVGVGLAMPDVLAPAAERRLIVKTLAILPGRAYAGLGYTLLEAAHQAGYSQGYRQAIHALMHRQNPSLVLSGRYHSQPLRRYVLMGKGLADRT